MHQCPGCGADMQFDIEKQMLYCSHCDKTMSVKDFEKVRGAVETKETVVVEKTDETTVDNTKEEKEKKYPKKEELIDITVYKCSQCGAELISDANTVATFCSYCGNPQMLTTRLAKTRKPRYVIPFKITQEEAFNKYKSKIASSLFVPREFKKNITLDKVRGIYMPFDILEYSYKGPVTVKGERHYVRGDYSITDYYDLNSNLDYSCELSGHDTASNFDDTLSEAICPYNVSEKEEFKEGYLTGFYADAADKYGNEYRQIYNDAIDDEIGKRIINSDKGYRGYSISKVKAGNSVVSQSTCIDNYSFCPVWFISCKHSNNKISYGVVNGQTGDTAIEIPISIPKFLIASLILSVILFCLYYFFIDFAITAKTMLIFVCVLNVIGSVISFGVSDLVKKREEEIKKCESGVNGNEALRPEGGVPEENQLTPGQIIFVTLFCFVGVLLIFFGINYNEISALIVGILFTLASSLFFIIPVINDFKNPDVDNKDIIISLIRNFLPIVISVLVIFIEKYRDDVFYATAIYVIINVTWVFIHNIKLYNKLTSRKLPQFNKRGGE